MSNGKYVPCTLTTESVGYASSTVTSVVTVPAESPAGSSPTAVVPAQSPAGSPATAVLPPPEQRESNDSIAPAASATGTAGPPTFKGAASGKSAPLAMSGIVAILAVGWLAL